MVYAFGIFMCRIALRIFFRRVEIEGREHVPPSGPLLLVPNHTNALIDAVVLAVHFDRPLNLTARSTLAEMPLMGLAMRAFNIVPIHRREDLGKGADMTANVDALAECRRRLGLGGVLCLFPEGQSHSDPQLRRFKHGAARIAVGFVDEGGRGLKILPVGLHFEEKFRFRSAVRIAFGPPIDAAEWRAGHPQADPRELTAKIESLVREITLNFERRRDLILLGWTAELLTTGGAAPPMLGFEVGTLAERVHLIKRIQNGYEQLSDAAPAEVDSLSRRATAYRSELNALGLEPPEVFLSLHPARAALFVARELSLLVLGLPVALWGTLNHFIAWLFVRRIARKFTSAPDQWASNVIFVGFVVFPLFYLLQCLAVYFALSPLWALGYAASLPPSGILGALYWLRARAMWRRARTFIYFVRHRKLRDRLVEEGRAIIAAITSLAERLDAA